MSPRARAPRGRPRIGRGLRAQCRVERPDGMASSRLAGWVETIVCTSLTATFDDLAEETHLESPDRHRWR